MKRIKIFILIIMIVFISGCTANYDLSILSNGEIKETATICFDNSEINADDINTFLDEKLAVFIESAEYSNYEFKKYIGDKTSKLVIASRYRNLNSYKEKSKIFSLAFNGASIIDYDGKHGIATSGNYNKDGVFGDNTEPPTFNKVDISVHLQNNLVSSNADSCDNELNTCYWSLNNDVDKFSLQFRYNNSKRYDIIIKEYIRDNWIGLSIVVVVVISGIIAFVILKKRNVEFNQI